MNKELLIEVLRKERDSYKEWAEHCTDEAHKENLLGQAAGINSVICMLHSDNYFKVVAEQNGIEVK